MECRASPSVCAGEWDGCPAGGRLRGQPRLRALHTSMGVNGTRMKPEGYTGQSITDAFIERCGIEAFAEFDRDV